MPSTLPGVPARSPFRVGARWSCGRSRSRSALRCARSRRARATTAGIADRAPARSPRAAGSPPRVPDSLLRLVKVGVPQETVEGERRVALVPETVAKLRDRGLEILVESGAGRDFNLDEAYAEAGSEIVDAERLYGEADLVAKVRAPSDAEVERLRDGQLVLCFLPPVPSAELIGRLAERGVTAVSMDSVPRIARAQSMDALSSQSSVAGYKCVLIGADSLGRYLPMMTTAAGTTKAAKVLILGAGVAGLQAIATAKRLGAEVTAFDIRPEVKEQIESIGATFLEEHEER
ncbi:MAG: hypothetical protein H0X55_11155, partial [Thermoleophilaceae bacterium]|nr:hypothetical protein [Thermoleophilaceae bacterium]